MKKANITLSYHFFVDCPECGAVLDLADDTYNSEHEIRNAIFTDQCEDLEGTIIACECCNNYFEIGEVCE